MDVTEPFLRALGGALEQTGARSVLILPPDITRLHSGAGLLTVAAYRELERRGIPADVMPALGTHMPLTSEEIGHMFREAPLPSRLDIAAKAADIKEYPGIPQERFLVHNWRHDTVELGRIEAAFVERVSEGAVSYDWPVQVNRRLLAGAYGLVVSIGQVVPQEVAGFANHTKNIFVGAGGKEAIDKSHFVSACYGVERIMGRVDTPVRALFDEGFRRYGGALAPVLWALTVVDTAPSESGVREVRGLFSGFGRECFEQAAELSRRVNITQLGEPIQKAVVWLAPDEFRSTWLGNKAIYRLRMALASGGELVILAPGLERFGEDAGVDALIRRYGYRPAADIRALAARERDLAGSLSAAAHLIHGSSEGRFTIRYCPGPKLSRREIESVGFAWGDLGEEAERYGGAVAGVQNVPAGWNVLPGGEKFYFVPNPALGLWVC